MKIDVEPRQDSLHARYSISIIDYFLFPKNKKEFDDFIEHQLRKIYNNIQKKITFLTYYYLIQNYLGPMRPLERLEELDIKRKKSDTIEQDDQLDMLKIKREKRKISKKIKHVISIIHSDSELKELFIDMNLEFEKKFRSPFLLKDVISKKLKF